MVLQSKCLFYVLHRVKYLKDLTPNKIYTFNQDKLGDTHKLSLKSVLHFYSLFFIKKAYKSSKDDQSKNLVYRLFQGHQEDNSD